MRVVDRVLVAVALREGREHDHSDGSVTGASFIPKESAKPTTIGIDSSQAAEATAAADQCEGPKQSGVGHISEIVDEDEGPVPVELVVEAKWEEIEILFLSDDRVQILRGEKRCESLNYAEFGFEDGRSGNPNQAWVVLRRLAEKKGWLTNQIEAQMEWSKVEKRIQEIRSVLRKYFGITSDPIPFIEKTRPQDKGGYNARFRISCGPSYRT